MSSPSQMRQNNMNEGTKNNMNEGTHPLESFSMESFQILITTAHFNHNDCGEV
jgi:hypothetical protein